MSQEIRNLYIYSSNEVDDKFEEVNNNIRDLNETIKEHTKEIENIERRH